MSTFQFELGEIDVCEGLPPPDPMWSMLMACCCELLNTAANEFRLRSLAFDKIVEERGGLLKGMRNVLCDIQDPHLWHSFHAADEMTQLIASYLAIVQVPSTRTEDETRQALAKIGVSILRSVYHYTMVKPLVKFCKLPD
jgi:hypothetical protein